MQVALWMKTDPYCVTPEDRLEDVAAVMRERGFRHAPVVDPGGRLIGMLSDRDLREHKGFLHSTKVSAAMTEPALAVGADDPIERVARLLLDHKVGGVPVVDADRRVIGIVTETDLLQGFLDGVAAGDHAARIDFHFTSPQQSFSDAVQAVEGSGGTVLGLGTFQSTADGSGARRFFIRLTAPNIDAIVGALAQRQIVVTAVHHLPATPAPTARS